MNIRDLIIEKKDEIEYGKIYASTVVFENYIDVNFDITTEGIGEKIPNVLTRAIDCIKKLIDYMKRWFRKVFNTLESILTPTSQLIKKYKSTLIESYKEYGNTIEVNGPIYDYNPSYLSSMVELIFMTYERATDEILDAFKHGFDNYNTSACEIRNDDLEYIVDDEANVDEDAAKKLGRDLIIDDPEVKVRKLDEAIDIESFLRAIDGYKTDLKTIKKQKKETEKSLESIIEGLKEFGISGPLIEKEVGDKAGREAVKWVKSYSKCTTLVYSSYLVEIKQFNRFINTAVKQLLKKHKESSNSENE